MTGHLLPHGPEPFGLGAAPQQSVKVVSMPAAGLPTHWQQSCQLPLLTLPCGQPSAFKQPGHAAS